MQPEQGIKRELSLGEVISKTIEVYRKDFTKYFILFAIVEVIIGLATAYAQHAYALPVLPTNPTSAQVSSWFSSFLGTFVALVGIIFVVTVVFFPIAQGTAIRMASEQIEKGQAELETSVRFAASKLIWIWALTILVGIIVIVGFIAIVVPGIILAIMFSLAFPVLLIENRGVLDSMSRSRELVGHRWGKTFATYVVLVIIFIIGSIVVGVITGPLGVASPVVTGILSAFYQPLFPIMLAVYYYSNLARITPPPTVMSPAASAIMAQAGVKYCSSCGTQVTSSAAFCPKCGAKLS